MPRHQRLFFHPLAVLVLVGFALLPTAGCKRDKQGAVEGARIDRAAKRAKCKTALVALQATLPSLKLTPDQPPPTPEAVKALPTFAQVQSECGEPTVQIENNEPVVYVWLFVGTEGQCSLTLRQTGVEDACKD